MRQTKSEQQNTKLDADFLRKLKDQTIAKNKEAEQLHSEPEPEAATTHQEKDRELLQWRGIDRFLDKEPPKADLLFSGKDWEIRSNLINTILATGGTGKTFFGLQIAASLATGISLEPFTPARKRKVLYLCGEDSEEILHERLSAIYKNMPGLEENRDHLSRNLCVESLVGMDRVLLELNENRNPTTTKTFDWLNKTIKSMSGLEVLVIDPMGKFHRLNENDNGHANAWISALEQLQVEHKLSIIFTHHESKAQVKNGSLEESSGRGAAALRDGV
jgi:RecA-family ATPase